MPLGKQAAAYTLASSFPDSCGKVQDAPPNPFSVFFPSALSIGSAFINTTPTFCKKSGSFVFPSHSGLGGEQGRPSVKIRRCITEELSLAAGKIFRAFQIVPPLPRAVWESPWGLAFLCNPGCKTLLPPFLPGGNFCVSHSQRDWGRTGPPRCKNAPVHNGRAIPRREKNLPRFPNCPAIAPSSLGKPLGFEFP